jgi:hypothetical protein
MRVRARSRAGRAAQRRHAHAEQPRSSTSNARPATGTKQTETLGFMFFFPLAKNLGFLSPLAAPRQNQSFSILIRSTTRFLIARCAADVLF